MDLNGKSSQHSPKISFSSQVDGCEHEQKSDDEVREAHFETAEIGLYQGVDDPVHGRNLCLSRAYRVLFRPLCGLIKHAFGQGPPEPEEVAQIAFEKLIHYRQRDQIRDLKAWLFIAARHVIIDYNRRQKLSQNYATEHVAFKSVHLIEQITPDSILEHRDEFQIVVAAMARLPEHQQAMIMMNRIEGFSYRAISRKTGWSIGYISGQLNDAMAQLTKALEQAERPVSR